MGRLVVNVSTLVSRKTIYSTFSFLMKMVLHIVQVMRPGLNVQLAPDAVARQLNVKSGALVLTVSRPFRSFVLQLALTVGHPWCC